ncbi:electron transport complex RsxE subunit [Achromatium sp. WMS3]|nr:electron transport complex RsxE subunit [Achromatium sp. WMS3]
MASNTTITSIILNGLWHHNQALVALLGLCSLLAITNSATNGLGMGIATTIVLTASNGTVSLIRHLVRSEIRLPVFVIVIASFVTTIELAMQAWFHELYQVLGIFIPLIVVNCIVMGRAEAYASKNSFIPALIDGAASGIGFTLVLVILGGIRELLGQGTLFAQAHLMFGEVGQYLKFSLGSGFQGAVIAILPPGAFLSLGFLIALKNMLDKRLAKDVEKGNAI